MNIREIRGKNHCHIICNFIYRCIHDGLISDDENKSTQFYPITVPKVMSSLPHINPSVKVSEPEPVSEPIYEPVPVLHINSTPTTTLSPLSYSPWDSELSSPCITEEEALILMELLQNESNE
jgi:hypothetical protein